MKRYHKLILLSFLFFVNSNVFSQEDQPKNGKLSEGLQAYEENGKMGFKDANGTVVLKPKFKSNLFSDLPFFKEGLCIYFDNDDSTYGGSSGNFGFINSKFEIVIPAKFPYLGFFCNFFPNYFVNGRAIVSQSTNNSNSYILIDKQGKYIGSPFEYSIGQYSSCLYFPEISEGLIAASNGGGYGFLNPLDGKVFIPFKFSLAGPFSEGLAVVEYNDQYISFIDKSGKNITNKRYYTKKRNSKKWSLYNGMNDEGGGDGHPGKFKDGKVIIRYYDNEGYGKLTFAIIDKKGNVIKKSTYEKYGEDPDFKKIIDLGD